MLFSRYASPFSLLDALIENNDLYDWITEFVEDENDRQIMDIWLHKIWDMSFDEFKRSLLNPSEEAPEDVAGTIVESRAILNNFVPEGGG